MCKKRISLLIITFLFSSATFSQILTESNSNLCISSILRKPDIGYYTSSIKPTAFHKDNNGNSLMAYYYYSQNCNGNYGGCYYSSIIKFDKAGNFLWEMSFEKNLIDRKWGAFYGAFINSITSDEEGNIYIAGNYGSESIDFGTGKIINEFYRTYNKSFFAKLDNKSGKTEWVIHDVNFESMHSGGTDLKYHNGSLFAAYIQFDKQKLKLPDDSFYYPNGKHGVLKISKEGVILDNMFIEMDNNLDFPGFINPDPLAIYLGRSIAIFPKIDINKNGKILISGLFTDSIFYNNSTTSLKLAPGKGPSFYLALINNDKSIRKALIPFYHQTEISYYNDFSNQPRICLDDNDNIYQAINIKNFTYSVSKSSIEIPGILSEDSIEASYIIKYNSEGKYIWHSKLAGKASINDLKFNEGLIRAC